MTEYRRRKIPGAAYFFTAVTQDRKPILTGENARLCLHKAFQHVQSYHPFQIEAIVLLPEHLHTIWKLPDNDFDYSSRWNWIKRKFTQSFMPDIDIDSDIPESKHKKRERGIWQRRYWEHCIRDEKDFIRHLDYIHYNPVKHGHVRKPKDWEWSSFHRYVKLGWYTMDWGDSDSDIENIGEI